MEEQKLLAYFLNWFISKPIYGIISVLDFDLVEKAKGVDVIQSLVLMVLQYDHIKQKQSSGGLRGLVYSYYRVV